MFWNESAKHMIESNIKSSGGKAKLDTIARSAVTTAAKRLYEEGMLLKLL